MVSDPSQEAFMLVSPHQTSEATGFPHKSTMMICYRWIYLEKHRGHEGLWKHVHARRKSMILTVHMFKCVIVAKLTGAT